LIVVSIVDFLFLVLDESQRGRIYHSSNDAYVCRSCVHSVAVMRR